MKVIVIAGPTASGKSDLGIRLAKKYQGEIISVDSRQVYQGMDLGTGKVQTEPVDDASKLERKLGMCLSEGVVHYLLDVVDPREETFNMAKFQKLAYQAINLIFSKNRLPFLVGGTMLYIDAVVKGYNTPGKKDESLRKDLQSKSLKELQQILKKIDKETCKNIDISNKYRLIRAVETKELIGEGFNKAKDRISPEFESLKLVLNPFSRKKLYKRIDERVDIRLEKGMIEEVMQLNKSGLNYESMEKMGLEYRYISRYLRGELDKQKMTDILKNKTHAYARRQLTWWRNDNQAVWIKNFQQAKKQIEEFIK